MRASVIYLASYGKLIACYVAAVLAGLEKLDSRCNMIQTNELLGLNNGIS